MVEKDAELIFSKEPDSKIIHVIRNPLERIAESLTSASLRKLSLGLEANLWRESSRLARRNFEKYPERYLIVKWESLLWEPEHTLETVCNFLGEHYYPELLNYHELEEIGLEVSQDLIGEKLRLSKLERGLTYKLTKPEKKFVSTYLNSEMSYFDYEVASSGGQVNEGTILWDIDYLIYLLGSLLNKPRIFIQKLNHL
jgi:hypothetical protein